MRTKKRCPICREVKGPEGFYIYNGAWGAYCKPCTNDYRRARNAAAAAKRPPSHPRPKGLCVFEGCVRPAKVYFRHAEPHGGPYCKAHYQQRLAGHELTPLRDNKKSYINDAVRRCTACELIKPRGAFYLRSNGKASSLCRMCANLVSSFNQALRKEQYTFALSITERMPESMKEKMLRRYATVINSDRLGGETGE